MKLKRKDMVTTDSCLC